MARPRTRTQLTCKCGNPAPLVTYSYPGKGSWTAPRKTCTNCRGSSYLKHRKDRCESCGWKPPTLKALEVDHVIPRGQGGTSDPANLRTLCPNCHRLKTLAERGLVRRGRTFATQHLYFA